MQFLPLLVQALYPTKRNWINKSGAIAGLVVGALISALLAKQIGGALGMPITFHPAEAGLIGLITNTIVAIVVSSFTKPVSEEKRLEYYNILAKSGVC